MPDLWRGQAFNLDIEQGRQVAGLGTLQGRMQRRWVINIFTVRTKGLDYGMVIGRP